MRKEATEQILVKLNHHLTTLTKTHRHIETLTFFKTQLHSNHLLKPDEYSLSSALSSASHRRDFIAGSQLHSFSLKSGLFSHRHVSNTLLNLYGKLELLPFSNRVFDEIEFPDVYSWTTMLSACVKLGDLKYALKVFDEMHDRGTEFLEFDEMPGRSTAVWNAVITGCAENGYEDAAFGFFRRMHRAGVGHDNYTFASVLSLCKGEMVGFAEQVHSLVIRTGFLVRPSVISSLIGMYCVCGRVTDAYGVFGEAEMCDEIMYNSMMAGLVKMGRGEEALMVFKEMLEVCLRPTELTFVSVMGSCSRGRIGFQVYVHVIKMGFDMYTAVGNAVITMCASCGDIYMACSIFETLREKDIVTWNTMISSYAQENWGEAAILAYMQMQNMGIKPDEFTIGSLFASSESIENVEMFQSIAIKNRLLRRVDVSNALVSAFAGHGSVEQAYAIFQEIPFKNLISWNTIISGLQSNGFPLQGIEQFSSMLFSGLKPNTYTLTIILSICGDMSSLKHGKEVHGYVLRQGFSSETSLGNSLITIYAKTGVLDWSLRVFNNMVFKDTISWNSLISAYAQHGKGKQALSCFEAMIYSSGSPPDQATFTSVLSACSHSGLVEDGLRIFNSMVNYYGFQPKGDHFSCIVDLLSRAGYLDEAERLVSVDNIKSDNNPWWALFSACVGYGDIRLGRIVAGILLENEKNDPSVYVQLSNIYSSAGQWEEAANVRKMMDRLGVNKTYGCSWIR